MEKFVALHGSARATVVLAHLSHPRVIPLHTAYVLLLAHCAEDRPELLLTAAGSSRGSLSSRSSSWRAAREAQGCLETTEQPSARQLQHEHPGPLVSRGLPAADI